MRKLGLLNNKVVKSGIWYTATEFFLKGIAFLTIPLFTRLLSPADYGLASLYMTWVGIFTITIGLNLNTSITKGKYDFQEDYDQFVSSVIFLSLLVFMGYIVVFIILGDKIQSIIGFNGFLFYFMLAQAYFTFIRNSLITKLRVEYKYKKISIISILINIVGVILSLVLILYVFQEEPYIGKVAGNGILIILFGVVFLWYLIKNGNGKLVNKHYWKYALSFSAPLIISSLSSLANAQFDRIVINQYVGETATGLYSFAYNVAMIIAVLTYALDQAWTPWVYEKMKSGHFDDIKKRGRIYRNLYSAAFSALLLLSPELIKIMADQSYWEALEIIPYIFAGFYFSYMYTLEMKTEFFYRKTSLLSLGTILSAIINIVLNLIFVPKYGYIAAAITTTISYMFLFVFHYLITSKVMKKSVYGLKFHIESLLYIAFITVFFVMFKEQIFIRIIAILAVIVLSLRYMVGLRKKKEI